MQYLLHRLDSMESNLRGEITGLRQDTNTRIDGLRQEMNTRIDSLHQELRSTSRWIIGTISKPRHYLPELSSFASQARPPKPQDYR